MFQRGSEWRRWDLHVHTPDTALNNGFGSWDEYLGAIAEHREVRVLGVTDYMSITNYSKLRKLRATDARLNHLELLIPNIEFRIAPPTEKATAINIHVLVCPDDINHESEVLNALARLHWEFNKRVYSCVPEQLIALGRAFNPGAASDRGALAVGVTQFKVDFAGFRAWYKGEHWLNHNSLIAVAAGDDGLSGFRKEGGWAALRGEVTRFSHILFSGRPGEREFWLAQGSAEERAAVYDLGGPKPCVHGSDAHEIAKLFKPDGNRYCWIKADTTFEGLRQILYEPGDRVHIGPTPPVYYDLARVIRTVKIRNSGGWFDDFSMSLNPGLVSIIGQKGSGKSALAELIAFASGSWQSEGDGFLNRAAGHIQGLSVELGWADDAVSEATLYEDQPGARDVRYLSQKFVERLCSEDRIGSELVREIESVIFSNIDPTDTLNASNFEELRTVRTERIREEGERIRQEIRRLIREECELRDLVAKVPEKKARIRKLIEERDGLTKQLPQATSAEEARIERELKQRRDALNALQQAVASHKQRLQKIADVKSRVSSFEVQMTRFYSEVSFVLKQLDIPEADLWTFQPKFAGETGRVLDQEDARLKGLIAKAEGSLENPEEGSLRWLVTQIKALSEQDSADKARQEKIKAIQTRLAGIAPEIDRINSEVAQIEGPLRERLARSRNERSNEYVSYFTTLNKEQSTLEELYATVRTSVGGTGAQDLEFSIRWEADVEKWLDRGGVLFDQRKTIPYGTMQELGSVARRILVPAWVSGEPKRIGATHRTFMDEFRKPDLRPQNYLRSGVTLEDLLNWLYEVEHISLSYGLKYNGVELEKLSPGTKGIVLLILYLGMDVTDTRPLVVDQPDENLDNESIYNLLTRYFKSAKNRRQIILITHNPNLVVNADSEQVIVASCGRRPDGLPHITYASGALEDSSEETGIREQVCRILEGGSEAFLKRERRYALEGLSEGTRLL